MTIQVNRASMTAGAVSTPLDEGLRSHMLGIYNRMSAGLLLTAIVAWVIASTSLGPMFFEVTRGPRGLLTSPTLLGWVAVFSPLAFVLALSFGLQKMSAATVNMLFWAFAACMGASMSSIFMVYVGSSVASTFFVTAGMFGATSLWGYTTGRDLTRMGSLLVMALIGIILATIVNIFLGSGILALVISVVGVLVFVGLTASDTQRIKNDYLEYGEMAGTPEGSKRATMDALTLYLNFVNMFQFLLSIMGTRRD